MKITINFATQPYQEMERFMLRWKLILSGAALLAIVLLSASVASVLAWRTTGMQAAELRRQLDEQDRMRSQVETLLSRPENQQIRLRAELLNSAIARKAFSWTEVFTDLERIMPPRLHVTSIYPEVNGDDQLELHLSVSGSSREDGIKLVRRLEEFSHFAQARINEESHQDPQKGRGLEVIQYGITAVYIPGFARAKSTAGEKEPTGEVATPPPAAVEHERVSPREVSDARY
jgi:hypothetical protein